MTDDQRIFLTGGTGFIGSHVLRMLLEQGRRVVALSRSGRNSKHLDDLDAGLDPGLDPGLDDDRLEVVTGDLLEPDTFKDALADCSHVMHIAGAISFRKADRKKMFRLNHEVTRNLWEACVETEPEKIMYLVSIFAHGCSGTDEPVDEDFAFDESLLKLRVPYLHAKREAGLMTRDYQSSGRLRITFGYPGLCIGPGDYYLSSMRVVTQFLAGKIPFFVDGGMFFVDVRDAADGLIKCLDKGEPGRKYLIGGYNLRWSEFFDLLASVSERPAPKRKLNYRLGTFLGRWMERLGLGRILSQGDVEMLGQRWFYDSSRSTSELGLEMRPLEDSLGDGIAWLRDVGLAA